MIELVAYVCGKKYIINPNPFYFYQAEKIDTFSSKKAQVILAPESLVKQFLKEKGLRFRTV